MKFLICPAPKDMLTDEWDFFKDPKGTSYMYEVELDEDIVCIRDTAHRMIPINVSDINDLMFILNRINNYVKSTETLNEFLYQSLISGASV